MAFVDPAKGEWRCRCTETLGDASAYDPSAHNIMCPLCERCGLKNPHLRWPFCGECNPNPDDKRPKILQTLCADCLAKVKPLTDAEIEAALEEGRKARAAAVAYTGMMPGRFR